MLFKIDIQWAQDQYLSTVLDVIGEYNKALETIDGKNKKKVPLKASDVKSYLI